MLPMPVNGREHSVEIQTHPSVKSEFGSGILMVCSFGDQNDVAVFRELGLTPFQAIDLNGCMTSIAGPLEGLSVLEARAKAIEILDEENNLVAIEERQQEVPVSERGKNPVEIILLKEWYVRQTHIQDRCELIEEIEFHPHGIDNSYWTGWKTSASIGQYLDVDGIILRFRFGILKMKNTSLSHLAGTYVQPWKDLPPEGSRALNRETREDIGSYDDLRQDLGEIQGEEKVFDTWMDSSNSIFVSGYLNQPEVFDKAFPTSLRPQGKEIVRTWLYYTLLKSALLLDKPGFKHVWIDGSRHGSMGPQDVKITRQWN